MGMTRTDRPKDFLVTFETGVTALLGSRMWVTEAARRELIRQSLAWHKVLTCEVGSPLEVALLPTVKSSPELATPHTFESLGPVNLIVPLS